MICRQDNELSPYKVCQPNGNFLSEVYIPYGSRSAVYEARSTPIYKSSATGTIPSTTYLTSTATTTNSRWPVQTNQMCGVCSNVQLGGQERLTFDSVCLNPNQDGLGCLSIEDGSSFNGCRYVLSRFAKIQ